MGTSAVPIKAVDIYNRAMDLSIRGDFNSALSEYRRAIDAYPTFIEAYNNLGEIYSRIGDRDLAIKTYKHALTINKDPKLLLNLGVEYYNHREFNSALNYFNESVILKPDFLEGNYYTGMTLFNLKDLTTAERHFDRVVSADRKHLKANYLLSYINFDWKNYLKTISYLDNIRDIADDKMFINKYYGFCHYHLGRYNEAIRYLNIAIEESPRYLIFKDYLQNLTFENKMKEIGDVDFKIREMEKEMMSKKPTMRDYTSLSVLYIYKGEYKKAEDILTNYKNSRKL